MTIVLTVNQRRRFAFVIGFLTVIAIVAWFLFHSREPEYQGKKLGGWLQQIESNQDVETREWQEAAQAVRQIGTNALPYLVMGLKASDPAWKIEAVDWVRQVLNKDLSDQLVWRHRGRALLTLRILGPIARPGIPEVAALITNTDPHIADAAFVALTEIGAVECVPPLAITLTNESTILRPAAAVSLGLLRGRAGDAVPALVTALQNSDTYLRAEAARALGMIGRNPRLAVPALTRALGDTNVQVVRSAAMALGAFGTEAESALSVLRALPTGFEEFPWRGIARSTVRVQCEMREGGIIRGPKDERRLALVFTGHEFAEGGDVILDELQKHGGKGSFFLTGDFLRNPQFRTLVARMSSEGHYVGPHSDKHLLYCAWENPTNTLVTEEQFMIDLVSNLKRIPNPTWNTRRPSRYFLPPFEHYNRDIADWARTQRWSLINYTPGTRSNADYTGEADKSFVSSQAIFDSILKRETDDPHGLNGFLLLLHVGSGPGRTDKFHARFGELLDTLAAKSYRFVGVDELLEPKREEFRNEYLQPLSR